MCNTTRTLGRVRFLRLGGVLGFLSDASVNECHHILLRITIVPSSSVFFRATTTTTTPKIAFESFLLCRFMAFWVRFLDALCERDDEEEEEEERGGVLKSRANKRAKKALALKMSRIINSPG